MFDVPQSLRHNSFPWAGLPRENNSCPTVISSANFTKHILAPRFLTLLLQFRMGCTRQGAGSGDQYLASTGKT